jgi:hypothetical protein
MSTITTVILVINNNSSHSNSATNQNSISRAIGQRLRRQEATLEEFLTRRLQPAVHHDPGQLAVAPPGGSDPRSQPPFKMSNRR